MLPATRAAAGITEAYSGLLMRRGMAQASGMSDQSTLCADACFADKTSRCRTLASGSAWSTVRLSPSTVSGHLS